MWSNSRQRWLVPPSMHAGLTRGRRWVSYRSFVPSAFGRSRWRLSFPVLRLAVCVPCAARTAPITPAWAPEKCVSRGGPSASGRMANRFGSWRRCSCRYDWLRIRALPDVRRHLGPLAVHVDSDVDRHCRASFASSFSPGAWRCRAERGRAPALIRVR